MCPFSSTDNNMFYNDLLMHNNVLINSLIKAGGINMYALKVGVNCISSWNPHMSNNHNALAAKV